MSDQKRGRERYSSPGIERNGPLHVPLYVHSSFVDPWTTLQADGFMESAVPYMPLGQVQGPEGV